MAKLAGSECHLVRVLRKPKHVPDTELFHEEVASEITFVEKELISARFLASQAGYDLSTHIILGDTCQLQLQQGMSTGCFQNRLDNRSIV